MNRIQFGRVRSTCSNFIRGPKTEPCVSAALAVAGVSVVVCLTLRKRGLMPKRMTREGWGGGGGKRDMERRSLRPSQLGYGTAAWTNP